MKRNSVLHPGDEKENNVRLKRMHPKKREKTVLVIHATVFASTTTFQMGHSFRRMTFHSFPSKWCTLRIIFNIIIISERSIFLHSFWKLSATSFTVQHFGPFHIGDDNFGIVIDVYLVSATATAVYSIIGRRSFCTHRIIAISSLSIGLPDFLHWRPSFIADGNLRTLFCHSPPSLAPVFHQRR